MPSAAEARKPLGIDVLAAARERIAASFDGADRVCVSFSGGKDSTVMLHLAMEEAARRGQRVGVLFVDLEGQYRLTIEHIERCLDMYAERIDEHWVALPLNLRNAVSQYEPQWMCWEPGREKDWIRKPPKRAITDEAHYPFFERGMEFEDFVPRFADWYADGGSLVSFVGIRTTESLNRWRSIASDTKRRWRGKCWTTIKGDGPIWNAYPIYDWRTEDIWTYHARYPGLPANGLYDLMHRAGLTIEQQRICQPYGDDQRKGLWLFHVIEPQTWAKIVARVNGANQGALYARESGNVLGQRKITRPEGHTWESFAYLLLDSMPAETAAHYQVKIDTFIQWWYLRGGIYGRGIPDETDPKLEAARKAPSWRRICKSLLRNDYWCKGLSFSQHRSGAAYAQYRARKRERQNHQVARSRTIEESR
jgi:predicted phosphoadenosine phosphosulfate sulfurtransferase